MISRESDVRLLRGLAIAVFVLAFSALFFQPRFSICFFYNATGWPCPGCGFTRAIAALLLLDWRQSFYLHPLGGAGFLVMLALFLPRQWLLAHKRWLNATLLGGAGVLLVFGLVRLVWIATDAPGYSRWGHTFEQERAFSRVVFNLLRTILSIQ